MSKDIKHSHNQKQWNSNGYNGQKNPGVAVAGFVPGLVNGYASCGCYYGPPNTSCYNQGLQIRYYSTLEAAPRAYSGYESSRGNSTEAAVQQALARAGYYNGPIDGSLGPMHEAGDLQLPGRSRDGCHRQPQQQPGQFPRVAMSQRLPVCDLPWTHVIAPLPNGLYWGFC